MPQEKLLTLTYPRSSGATPLRPGGNSFPTRWPDVPCEVYRGVIAAAEPGPSTGGWGMSGEGNTIRSIHGRAVSIDKRWDTGCWSRSGMRGSLSPGGCPYRMRPTTQTQPASYHIDTTYLSRPLCDGGNRKWVGRYRNPIPHHRSIQRGGSQ